LGDEDVTVTMMLAGRPMSRIRDRRAGADTAALVLLVGAQSLAHCWCSRPFGTAVDRCDRVTYARGSVAPPGSIEVDGFAFRGTGLCYE
jgi:hypothetical protein